MNHCVVTLRHVGGSLLLRCMPTYVAYPVHSQGCSTLPGSFDMVGPQLHSARQEVPECPSLGPADMEAISRRSQRMYWRLCAVFPSTTVVQDGR